MFLTPEILAYAHDGDDTISTYRDKAWQWCGFVKSNLPFMGMACQCSNRATVEEFLETGPPKVSTITSVILRRYNFVESDMLMITVFIGKCDRCDRVYWYQSAPPYSRIGFQKHIKIV